MSREVEKLNFPYEWKYDPNNELVCDREGVLHHLETVSAGKTYSLSVKKSFQSGHTARPTNLRLRAVPKAKLEASRRKLMQAVIRP